jgi:hypothetical protein
MEVTEGEQDELRQELEAIKYSRREPAEEPETPRRPPPTDAGGEARATLEDTQVPQEERKGWFRRLFGL